MRCRLDYDTSVGDMTYSSVQNTLPMLKELLKSLEKGLSLSQLPLTPPAESNSTLTSTEALVDLEALAQQESKRVEEMILTKFKPERSLRIFFPDMGAAALARRDWKMGTFASQVPHAVFTANVQNDPLISSDQLAVILCPQYSETDYVKRVLDSCAQMNIPCLIINPELINMDQGYGVRKLTSLQLAALIFHIHMIFYLLREMVL